MKDETREGKKATSPQPTCAAVGHVSSQACTTALCPKEDQLSRWTTLRRSWLKTDLHRGSFPSMSYLLLPFPQYLSPLRGGRAVIFPLERNMHGHSQGSASIILAGAWLPPKKHAFYVWRQGRGIFTFPEWKAVNKAFTCVWASPQVFDQTSLPALLLPVTDRQPTHVCWVRYLTSC